MQKKKIYNFTVYIEQDEDGYYIGSVPSLKGCHTQGKTLDELMRNMKEAIELCLEVEGKHAASGRFIGVQNIEVTL